jgi:hypothetical protein
MGNDLIVSGRMQLAGYAGLAGMMRGRGRRIAVIAAVDVLAVVLAFGALHITGAMMGGGSQMPQLIPPVSAATEPVSATTPLVPAPRIAPKPEVFAAMPDAAVMFAEPTVIASGFTFTPDASSSSSFAPPQQVALAEPTPESAPMPMPTPHLRPVARLAQIAAPAIDATDGSLDRLVLRDVVPDATAAITTQVAVAATSTLGAVGSTVDRVTSVAPPVQTLAQSVTAPVSQAMNNVVGLLN